MRISIGDHVVYPAHGVGRVTALGLRQVAGQRDSFASIQLFDTGLAVMVPVEKLDVVGVRHIIDANLASDVLDVFDLPVPSRRGISWIRTSRDYEARVASGQAGEVAGVLRDLYVMKWGGPLSFGQLRLFERSRRLIVRELSIALDDAPDRVERVIVERIRAANAA